jgi:TolB-like protein/Tfp pilus assembly protein PilF
MIGLNVGGLREQLLGGPKPAQIQSLAVLPLENLSGDPEQDYFAAGMHEELIATLSRISALKVISRTSAVRYKGSDKPLPEIGRELGVDGIIEGSVRRAGQQVRITVQLIDAASDRHLWTDSYQRELLDVLALQSELAQAIAREIKIAVTPQQAAHLAARRPVNPETYEAYLKGMFWLNKATPEGTRKGMAYLREAVEKDPGDALAYAGLALGYITLAHGPAPPKDALPLARAAAEKALDLDDTLAEPFAALAFVKGYYEWDWAGAEQALQRALDLNPSLAIAHFHVAWFHVLFGRMEEAITEHKRAQELDPLMPLNSADLGQLYVWDQRYEEAMDEVEKSIEIDPNYPHGHWVRGIVYREKGMYEEAIAAHQKAGELSPTWRWVLGCTYAAAGRTDEARKLLAELKEEEITPWRAFWLAKIYTALGEKDEAFRWLNYEHPHLWVPWIRVWPDFEPLRDDPRFDDLLRRMNLPE